jgi:hypothetical protein
MRNSLLQLLIQWEIAIFGVIFQRDRVKFTSSE